MKIISICLFIISIIIASFSQILLKKGSQEKKIIINKYTILGYGIMILSTLCTLVAYRNIDLSFGGILQSLSYMFVAFFSFLFLKEKITKQTLIGISVIIIGIIIYSL